MIDDDDVPGFEVLWQVTTPARTYESRTGFDRFEQDLGVATERIVYVGWGPYWWFDPLYPRMVFVRHRPIFVRHPVHVNVMRPHGGDRHRR